MGHRLPDDPKNATLSACAHTFFGRPDTRSKRGFQFYHKKEKKRKEKRKRKKKCKK